MGFLQGGGGGVGVSFRVGDEILSLQGEGGCTFLNFSLEGDEATSRVGSKPENS